MKNGTKFVVEVNPKIPRKLVRLEELANNLWYSWDRPTRTLFARLHPGLWGAVGNSPKVFLRRVDEHRLMEAVEDQVFLGTYNRVLSAFDTYHNEPLRREDGEQFKPDDLVAYFCAEFGFHESFPIYSGGLGILAGDHCKAASDMRLPFVAVGLLYRQGYFTQVIDATGEQLETYTDSDFDDLPISPALRDDGSEIRVEVELSGRKVAVKVWQALVGHVKLYLLDTDLEENAERDRDIAHQLYGGDRHTRIQQEIVLGVGGVRALKEIGLAPTVWHINEGHAAFLLLERIRALTVNGLDFASALEAVAVNTVFTTHTPVPAGHDHFSQDMIAEYFQPFLRDMGIPREQLLSLGTAPEGGDFNMTVLAIRGSRHHNGVSKIHGKVSSEVCANLWPQLSTEESPMSYVTNGVHVPTFLAQEWADLFDNILGYEWRHRLTDQDYWTDGIDRIPDHLFWSVRQSLKAQMLHVVRYRVTQQHYRNHGSEAHLDRLLKYADSYDPNVLTIGFARRFATYKRAALIFEDLNWLREIIADEDRPVLFIFAGKAHPADQPGQDLIRLIHNIGRMPEFEGKVMLIEGYDMGLGRRLVAGVDVWLNNPIYPQEASGTSGMKAAINGAINLSVLDGWWAEGYDEQQKNGWAIKPNLNEVQRNLEDSHALYEILQDQVVPLYYDRGKMGFSEGWVEKAKRSIATVLPRFNASRMVGEYVSRFYFPAARNGRIYADRDFDSARTLAAWKAKIRQRWSGVTLRRVDNPKKRIPFGDALRFEVALRLNGLSSDDVLVELLVNRSSSSEWLEADVRRFRFKYDGQGSGDDHRFTLDLAPDLCGKLEYRIRVYPFHSLLTHPMEMGLMVWL